MDNFKERYRQMLVERGKTNKDVALDTGNSVNGINSIICQTFPRWAKLSVIQHEEDKLVIEKLKDKLEEAKKQIIIILST